MCEDAPISTYFFEYFPFSLISYRSAEVAAVFFPSILLAFFLVVFFIFRFFFNESSWRASGDASDNHRSGRSSRGREEVGREGRQSTTSFVAETTPFPLAYAA